MGIYEGGGSKIWNEQSSSEFIHWLAAESRIDDNSLQSLFKR
jgi:hypothetical protein